LLNRNYFMLEKVLSDLKTLISIGCTKTVCIPLFQSYWNQGMLQSSDLMEAAMAAMQKKEAKFSKL